MKGKGTYLAALGAFAAFAVMSSSAYSQETSKAKAAAEEITTMRSTLAKSVIKPGAEITEETFQKTCGAVAKRVKELTEKDGLIIRHSAPKNRNPKNAATAEDAAFFITFEGDKTLHQYSDTITKDGAVFERFIAPIYVEEACLACHGKKSDRPKFIVEKYPDDKAYGFKTGDLRGLIIVLAPQGK